MSLTPEERERVILEGDPAYIAAVLDDLDVAETTIREQQATIERLKAELRLFHEGQWVSTYARLLRESEALVTEQQATIERLTREKEQQRVAYEERYGQRGQWEAEAEMNRLSEQQATIERLMQERDEFLKRPWPGCRMLSRGERCSCSLCKAEATIREQQATIERLTAEVDQWEFYFNGSFCRRCGAAIGSGSPCRP